jgi:hypothetical protein
MRGSVSRTRTWSRMAPLVGAHQLQHRLRVTGPQPGASDLGRNRPQTWPLRHSVTLSPYCISASRSRPRKNVPVSAPRGCYEPDASATESGRPSLRFRLGKQVGDFFAEPVRSARELSIQFPESTCFHVLTTSCTKKSEKNCSSAGLPLTSASRPGHKKWDRARELIQGRGCSLQTLLQRSPA